MWWAGEKPQRKKYKRKGTKCLWEIKKGFWERLWRKVMGEGYGEVKKGSNGESTWEGNGGQNWREEIKKNNCVRNED